MKSHKHDENGHKLFYFYFSFFLIMYMLNVWEALKKQFMNLIQCVAPLAYSSLFLEACYDSIWWISSWKWRNVVIHLNGNTSHNISITMSGTWLWSMAVYIHSLLQFLPSIYILFRSSMQYSIYRWWNSSFHCINRRNLWNNENTNGRRKKKGENMKKKKER